MEKFTKGDFDYIKFEEGDNIEEFLKTFALILFADKEKNLYCFNYVSCRAVRFDAKQYKWVIDDRKEIEDFKDIEQVDEELAKLIFKAIPPYDCFLEYDRVEEEKTLQYYDDLRKNTPKKVIGWLKEPYDYEPADSAEGDDIYGAAIINDIVEHNYFFVADWMQLIPVFNDGTYLELSSRSMGFLIGISRRQAKELDYVDYAFGEPYWDEPDSFFNKPEEGLY